MKIDRFNILFNDPECLKIEKRGTFYLFSKKNQIIICFTFFHSGLNNQDDFELRKRVILSVIKKSDLQVDKKLFEIDKSKVLLVNAHEPSYAFSFYIEIESNSVQLKVDDKPEIGEDLFTDDEINGIKIMF